MVSTFASPGPPHTRQTLPRTTPQSGGTHRGAQPRAAPWFLPPGGASCQGGHLRGNVAVGAVFVSRGCKRRVESFCCFLLRSTGLHVHGQPYGWLRETFTALPGCLSTTDGRLPGRHATRDFGEPAGLRRSSQAPSQQNLTRCRGSASHPTSSGRQMGVATETCCH
jgi:hypothetical protein